MAASIINSFTDLVMFRKPTRTTTGKGQKLETFADFRQAMVKIEQPGGSEQLQGEKMTIPYSYTLTGYNDTEVDETFRINFDGDDYNIVSIERFNRRLFMKLKIEKVFT